MQQKQERPTRKKAGAVKTPSDLRVETRRLEDGRGGTVSAVIAYPAGFTAGRVPGVILAHGAEARKILPAIYRLVYRRV
jgi:hypothetical protein